jgi:hypothetical protein
VLADFDDFGRAAAEFDIALDPDPGSAVILPEYSGWASTFDAREHGAEAADGAIWLDPDYPI